MQRKLEQEVKTAQEQLIAANNQAREPLEKLAKEQAVHTQETRALCDQLSTGERRSYQFELEYVRAKALLDAQTLKLTEP